MEKLYGALNGIGGMSCTLAGVGGISVDMIIPKVVQTNPFQGEYEYTPSADTQTIEIAGLRALENITINPIPNNYGLITWDGSTITVS